MSKTIYTNMKAGEEGKNPTKKGLDRTKSVKTNIADPVLPSPAVPESAPEAKKGLVQKAVEKVTGGKKKTKKETKKG